MWCGDARDCENPHAPKLRIYQVRKSAGLHDRSSYYAENDACKKDNFNFSEILYDCPPKKLKVLPGHGNLKFSAAIRRISKPIEDSESLKLRLHFYSQKLVASANTFLKQSTFFAICLFDISKQITLSRRTCSTSHLEAFQHGRSPEKARALHI